ncbi:hypothetical protein DLM85_08105 [Hymenobacter edaphi]|uniref:ArsR family transcriptional regulator n=1 Tax=Hymenobacter edaphi TaxID=2211146 RepID=A0A328BMS9_9BACT|nr:hypothetical protein DLM85_08105 [Hymenobacter edaphi]
MTPTGVAAIDDLAARIARRDQPREQLDPLRFTPERIRARVAAALPALAPGSNVRGYATMSRMCYAFVEQEEATAAQLAALGGVQRLAAGQALGALVRGGLLRWHYAGPRRRYRLTRFGEDWLLALARCEVPPAPPVAEQ